MPAKLCPTKTKSSRSLNLITFRTSSTAVSIPRSFEAKCALSPIPVRVTGYASCPCFSRVGTTLFQAQAPSHAPGTRTNFTCTPSANPVIRK